MIPGTAACLNCDADALTHEFITVTDRRTLEPKGKRVTCTCCGEKGPRGIDEKEAKTRWNEAHDDGVRTHLLDVA